MSAGGGGSRTSSSSEGGLLAGGGAGGEAGGGGAGRGGGVVDGTGVGAMGAEGRTAPSCSRLPSGGGAEALHRTPIQMPRASTSSAAAPIHNPRCTRMMITGLYAVVAPRQ